MEAGRARWQHGIGWGATWGLSGARMPALGCAPVLALVTPEHPQGHGVAGAARATGKEPREGREEVQKHQGCGAKEVGFALSITHGVAVGAQGNRKETKSCGAGGPSDLPTHPWLLHALPIISMPTWEAGGSLQFYPTPKWTL